ncbi:MAG: hypothetical protein KDD45_10290 [Bdellovibrionales bacterium]|nr:hypothetical protein [Bdellovibrionales bacterium]
MKFFLIIICLFLSLLYIDLANSSEEIKYKKQLRESLSHLASEKTITCDAKIPSPVKVSFGRVTVLNFPFKPKEVVPGNQAFDFKQIRNDLVIMATGHSSQTNAVIYLEERRCVFNLRTVKSGGDDVLIVKDPKDAQIEVRF